MKFYVVSVDFGGVIGCETSKARAVKLVRESGAKSYSITCVTCTPNTETVRRLLGNVGGFAENSVEVII